MLKVFPIQSKDEQKSMCEICKVTYIPSDLAYRAENDGEFGGICQFRIEGGKGYIDTLSQVKDKDDFTLMFVLGRAAMNFIDLCGVHTCYATIDTAPESLLLSIGLKKQEDGTFFADMKGMFTGGCCSCKK